GVTEGPLLGTVERERGVGRLVVRVSRDRGGGPEETPQDGSVGDDAAIAIDLGRGGYALGERAEVRLATRPVELLTAGELHLDGERIDPLPPLEERLGRVVDPLMPRYVELVDAQEVRD